jgi:predicted ATPase
MDLVIHRVRSLPLLIVVTHRPEFLSRWSHYGHVAALTLSKLARPQSTAMVWQLAGGKALPADLLEQILGKTDGVPLFVEELTKSILESPDLREARDRWEYAGRAGMLAIPSTLRDSLMARLDRFAPVREIAQIGAAIGREFGYELIAAVAPQSKPELDKGLALLVESGLALQQGTPPDAVYTPSNTPWCRTPRTTRCSERAGGNYTARSRGSSRSVGRTPRRPSPSCWRITTPRRTCCGKRSRFGRRRAA